MRDTSIVLLLLLRFSLPYISLSYSIDPRVCVHNRYGSDSSLHPPLPLSYRRGRFLPFSFTLLIVLLSSGLLAVSQPQPSGLEHRNTLPFARSHRQRCRHRRFPQLHVHFAIPRHQRQSCFLRKNNLRCQRRRESPSVALFAFGRLRILQDSSLRGMMDRDKKSDENFKIFFQPTIVSTL